MTMTFENFFFVAGIRHHVPSSMGCNFKLMTPKLSSSAASASCTLDPRPTNQAVEAVTTCVAGLVREKVIGCPFQHTCLLGICYNRCYFGYCQDLFFLGAAALVGLILSTMFNCCLLCYCRRKWQRKLKVAEGQMREMVSKPYNITVEDDLRDSDKEDEVPDLLPPTFFVRDRED